MMHQQTFDKLHALRWFGLAEAWRKQMENPEVASLSFDERFGLLVDQHWTWRENQAMAGPEEIQAAKRTLCGRYRFPASPRVGSFPDAHPHELTMGDSTSRDLVYRPDRDRQVVVGAGSSAESLPRRIRRLVSACWQAIPRPDDGTRRWQRGPDAGNHCPHRCTGGRRFCHGSVERAGTARFPGDLRRPV